MMIHKSSMRVQSQQAPRLSGNMVCLALCRPHKPQHSHLRNGLREAGLNSRVRFVVVKDCTECLRM